MRKYVPLLPSTYPYFHILLYMTWLHNRIYRNILLHFQGMVEVKSLFISLFGPPKTIIILLPEDQSKHLYLIINLFSSRITECKQSNEDTLLSKRSVHWFQQILPITLGDKPWPKVMLILSNGLGSNMQKAYITLKTIWQIPQNQGSWSVTQSQRLKGMTSMCTSLGEECKTEVNGGLITFRMCISLSNNS